MSIESALLAAALIVLSGLGIWYLLLSLWEMGRNALQDRRTLRELRAAKVRRAKGDTVTQEREGERA